MNIKKLGTELADVMSSVEQNQKMEFSNSDKTSVITMRQDERKNSNIDDIDYMDSINNDNNSELLR